MKLRDLIQELVLLSTEYGEEIEVFYYQEEESCRNIDSVAIGELDECVYLRGPKDEPEDFSVF